MRALRTVLVSVLLLALGAPAASATLPQATTGTLDLATFAVPSLTGSGGEGLGTQARVVGDVDGDGSPDVAIGAPLPFGGAGKVYVVSGAAIAALPPGPTPIATLQADGDAVAIVGAAAGDELGSSRANNVIQGAGDVNGDGRPDLVVSSSEHAGDAGAAWIVYGWTPGTAPAGGTIQLATLAAAAGFRIDPPANVGSNPVALGDTVGTPGDLDGDDLGDVALGAPGDDGDGTDTGAVYVIRGTAGTPGNLDLSAAPPAARVFRVAGANAAYGQAADLNGDGVPDLIVGQGSVFDRDVVVVAGPFDGLGFDVTAQPAARLETIANDGDDGLALFSGAVDMGDVNDDGRLDLLLGASRENGVQGAAYVVYTPSSPAGATSFTISSIPAGRGYRLAGRGFAAISVVAPGDVNGDGVGDVVFGSSESGTGGRGALDAVFGRASGLSGSIDPLALPTTDGFHVLGAKDTPFVFYGGIGQANAGGDLDGDGLGDLVVGLDIANSDSDGEAWFVRGFRLPTVAYPGPTLSGKVGQPFSVSPSVRITAPATFAVAHPLPPGLAIDATTGEISGTPTAAAPSTVYIVTMTDAVSTVIVSLRITVEGLATSEPPTAPPAAPSAAPTCLGRSIVLAAVIPAGGDRVRISGVALARYAGQPVTVSLGFREVGQATIRSDGTFEVIVRSPSAATRQTARYTATVAGRRSAALRLERNLLVLSEQSTSKGLRVRARLFGVKRTQATIKRQVGCRPPVRVRTVAVGSDGTLTATLPLPATGYALYRITAKLHRGSTYTLPIVVRARG